MTTSVKLRTNGNYVSQLKDSRGNVLGSAGPGSNVESEWINFPHGQVATIEERQATDEEVAAANKPTDEETQQSSD